MCVPDSTLNKRPPSSRAAWESVRSSVLAFCELRAGSETQTRISWLYGVCTTISCMKKTRQRKDFLKKATFEEINFRKKTFGGIYLYKTWKARFVIQCNKVLGFFQVLQDSVTYFVYFCQFGNFLLISSCCFEENFWLFHARNCSNVAHIFC